MNGQVIQGRFDTGRPVLTIPSIRPPLPMATGAQPSAVGVAAPRPTPPTAGTNATVQLRATGDTMMVDPTVLRQTGPGQPLPPSLRGEMERALGADFAAVRIHVGRQAAAIGALAFTSGSDIFFAQGRYLPQTTEGRRLLGHELAHVVQQRQGGVRNPFGSGVAVIQNPQLEAEADRMGQRAASLRPAPSPPASAGRAGTARNTAGWADARRPVPSREHAAHRERAGPTRAGYALGTDGSGKRPPPPGYPADRGADPGRCRGSAGCGPARDSHHQRGRHSRPDLAGYEDPVQRMERLCRLGKAAVPRRLVGITTTRRHEGGQGRPE